MVKEYVDQTKSIRLTKKQKTFVEDQCLNIGAIVRKLIDQRMKGGKA